MSNVIVSIFTIALIMVAVLILALASISSTDRVLVSWDGMVQRDGGRDRTELTLIDADITGTSTNVDISILNSGQTALRDYANWDVVIQYYATSSNQGLSVSWLTPATTTPPCPPGQWTVSGLYLDADALEPEVYDPNVFNPGEEMIMRLNITPAIPADTDNLVTIGAPNGVTVAAPFSR